MKKETFDETYERYAEEVKKQSAGLVVADKTDFLKMAAFFSVVDNDHFEEMQKQMKKY